MNRLFSKEDTRMSKEHVKIRSASVAIRETQIILGWTISSPPLGWLESKADNIKYGVQMEKLEPHIFR